MTMLKRQVRQARHRLWLNRWLRQFGWLLFAAATIGLIVRLADSLFSLQLPAPIIAFPLLGAALLGSFLWLALSREQDLSAAVALDEAAGLRERVSTSLHIPESATDPFSAAVLADTERAVAGLTPAKVLPVRWSRSLSWCAFILPVAALSFLLPDFNLFGRKDSQAEAQGQNQATAQVRNIVSRPMSAISQMANEQADPELEKQLKGLEEALKTDTARDPDVLRREAVKQLDKLQDTLKQKTAADRFKALDEVKKRLSQLGKSEDPKSEIGRLMDAMNAGDMAGAKKEVEKLKENLAKRAREGKVDSKQAEEMKKQLNELAKKLEKAGEDSQTKRELQNAGLKEEDIKRVLETLAKKDPKQIEKLAKELSQRMKDKGIDSKQLEKMMEKIAQRQEACKKCKGMGEQMSKAAQKLSEGDTEAAQDELGKSEEMLSEMEQLEQSLNEIEGKLSMLDEARDELNEGDSDEGQDKCGHCKGSGFRKDGTPCAHCNGSGQGGLGRGSGNRDRANEGEVDFKSEKAKVKTRSGSVIAQDFVEGKPIVGKSEVEFREAAGAAEIDATDALNRDRIPRAYRKGVRNYFDRLGDSFDSNKGGKAAPAKTEPPPPEEKESKK